MARFLRLHAEAMLQSWGTVAPADTRPTEVFTTWSGIVGVISACAGFLRGDPRITAVSEASRVSCRPLRTGRIVRDFHVLLGVYRDPFEVKWESTARRRSLDRRKGSIFHRNIMHHETDGKNKVAERFYLEDWAFEVLVAWDDSVAPFPAETALAVLQRPTFAPYLGRKGCRPLLPLVPVDAEVLEGDSPLDLFRPPTFDEVKMRCAWHWKFTNAPEDRREAGIERWFNRAYPLAEIGSGPVYLHVDTPPPNHVPHQVRDRYHNGHYYDRTLYEIPPAEETRDEETQDD